MAGRSALAIAVLFLVLGTATARADGITITSGWVVVASGIEGAASMSLVGDNGFSISSTLSRQSRVDARACGNWIACGPGDVISLGATWSGLDFFGPTATYNGVSYPQVGGANSPNGMSFVLDGSATAPAFATTADAVRVQAPFSLEGLFSFADSATSPVTTLGLAGSGVATLNLVRGTGAQSNTWVFNGVRYDFGAAPVPTPEPTTLVLLGSGLVALRLGRNRRRR